MADRDGPEDRRRLAAREALRRRDYAAAIADLERHVAAHPGDAEAEIELGLARLLAGDEAGFAATHNALAARLALEPPRPGRAARLWETCRATAGKMARAAAILSALGIPPAAAACGKRPPAVDSAPAPLTTIDAAEPPAALSPDASSGPAITDVAPAEPDVQPAPPPDAAPPAPDAEPAPATADAVSADASSPGPGDVPTPEVRPAEPRDTYRPPVMRYVVARPRPVPGAADQNWKAATKKPDEGT